MVDVAAIRNSATAPNVTTYGNPNHLKVVFIPDGIIKARFYSDQDSRVMKTFKRHRTSYLDKTGVQKSMHVQCLIDTPAGCPICDYLVQKSTLYPGINDLKKFVSRDCIVTYAYIFSYEGIPSDYVVLKKPVVLMGGNNFILSYSDMISQLPDDELRSAFTPSTPHSLWTIKTKNFDVNITMDNLNPMPMEELPPTAPPLSEVFYVENEPPKQEMVAAFIGIIQNTIDIYTRTVEPKSYQPPSNYQHPAGTPVSNPRQAAPQQTYVPPPQQVFTQPPGTVIPAAGGVDSRSSVAPPWEESSVDGKPTCFSHHRESDAECISCEFELGCKSSTS